LLVVKNYVGTIYFFTSQIYEKKAGGISRFAKKSGKIWIKVKKKQGGFSFVFLLSCGVSKRSENIAFSSFLHVCRKNLTRKKKFFQKINLF